MALNFQVGDTENQQAEKIIKECDRHVMKQAGHGVGWSGKVSLRNSQLSQILGKREEEHSREEQPQCSGGSGV